MIARNEIIIDSLEDDRSVTLAPFGFEEAESMFPMSDDAVVGSPSDALEKWDGDPDLFWNALVLRQDVVRWGIYAPLEERTAFLGFIALIHTDLSVPEIGTFIATKEARHKGIGTLAKVGLIEYARDRGALAVYATTTTTNTPARGGLNKVGFTNMGAYGEPEQYGRDRRISQPECWYLETDLARDISERQDPQLLAGWQRYEELRERTNIRFDTHS